jgi:hypothetical protein
MPRFINMIMPKWTGSTPVGATLFVGCAVGRVRMEDVMKEIWPFYGVMFIVLMLVTLGGAGGAVMAEQLPYALLFQGQPYRSLWLLAFLHVPLLCWLRLAFPRTCFSDRLPS